MYETLPEFIKEAHVAKFFLGVNYGSNSRHIVLLPVCQRLAWNFTYIQAILSSGEMMMSEHRKSTRNISSKNSTVRKEPILIINSLQRAICRHGVELHTRNSNAASA